MNNSLIFSLAKMESVSLVIIYMYAVKVHIVDWHFLQTHICYKAIDVMSCTDIFTSAWCTLSLQIPNISNYNLGHIRQHRIQFRKKFSSLKICKSWLSSQMIFLKNSVNATFKVTSLIAKLHTIMLQQTAVMHQNHALPLTCTRIMTRHLNLVSLGIKLRRT